MDNNQNGFNEDNLYMYGKQASNGFAIASFVLGLISVLCCCVSYLSIVLGVLAIVFAAVQKIKCGTFGGLGIAGLVLGIVSCVLFISDMVLSSIFANEIEAILAEYEQMLSEYGVNMNA